MIIITIFFSIVRICIKNFLILDTVFCRIENSSIIKCNLKKKTKTKNTKKKTRKRK